MLVRAGCRPKHGCWNSVGLEAPYDGRFPETAPGGSIGTRPERQRFDCPAPPIRPQRVRLKERPDLPMIVHPHDVHVYADDVVAGVGARERGCCLGPRWQRCQRRRAASEEQG